MAGLRLNCPECGKALQIRSSTRPSATVTIAYVYCERCELKGVIRAGFEQGQFARFEPIKSPHQWAQDLARQATGKK
ncbi:ogr/Delta-like zinc finger family protein [Rodentibacter pneumotropicus]|uniref:ogr/Delta-like zinc finger family protein n=1 Tax=Rodentibacter pneumotropicus TaxID=758 RepID=UPI00109BFCDD|nr:ogr/Delta-like zinc finger family protein [Rodentibacter pneumotropicus]THA00557.1 transposase [Rodentibacter pneumotropicus]